MSLFLVSVLHIHTKLKRREKFHYFNDMLRGHTGTASRIPLRRDQAERHGRGSNTNFCHDIFPKEPHEIEDFGPISLSALQIF